MSTHTLDPLTPAVVPTTRPSAPATPAAQPETVFPPSPELGAQLAHLAEAQAEIDRRKAEELARLREIQDRD